VAATFALVFALSYATFLAIKMTIGLRVPEDEEQAGLDISAHGMYGLPEAFIPPEEYPGADHRVPKPAASSPVGATAMTADRPSQA